MKPKVYTLNLDPSIVPACTNCTHMRMFKDAANTPVCTKNPPRSFGFPVVRLDWVCDSWHANSDTTDTIRTSIEGQIEKIKQDMAIEELPDGGVVN